MGREHKNDCKPDCKSKGSRSSKRCYVLICRSRSRTGSRSSSRSFTRRSSSRDSFRSSRSSIRSSRNRDSSRSRSRSRSPYDTQKRSNVPKTSVMTQSAPVVEKLEISPIPLADLKKIKIDIHLRIPTTEDQPEELQRDIVNPEEIVVTRKDGEGVTPIFNRPELKPAGTSTPGVEKIYTISSAQNGESRSSRKRPSSSSIRRRRSSSAHRRSSNLSPQRRRSKSLRQKLRKHSQDRRRIDRPRSRNRNRSNEGCSRDQRHHRSSLRDHSSRHRSVSRSQDDRHCCCSNAHHSYDRRESYDSRQVPYHQEPVQYPYDLSNYPTPAVLLLYGHLDSNYFHPRTNTGNDGYSGNDNYGAYYNNA